MMELNAKNPLLWDLENLVMFNTNTGEPPKTLQLVDLEIEGIEGFEVESFYSSGVGYVSSSRSSKSASDESSTNQEVRETQFSMETNDCFKEDFEREEFVKSEPTKASPTVESSVVSGESLTALELCNRTYFKDIPGVTATNAKNTAQTSVPSNSSDKKPKYSSLSMEVPRCQVAGCNVDLSLAKDYHRKHKVCESHSKSSRVVINGRERRFCQQCSRFHGLSEFDQKKRSCRRRLSDHNARRRKPKPEVIQFNSMRLASSLHEGRNQLNFSFNQVQMHSKAVVPKSDLFTKVSPISNHFLPSKGTPLEVYQRGLPTSAAPSNMEATQNQGALSLLSTTSWGSSDPHSINPSSVHPSPAIHGGPPVSSEFWIGEQPATSGPHPPSFQLFKASNESSFYLY